MEFVDEHIDVRLDKGFLVPEGLFREGVGEKSSDSGVVCVVCV